MQKKKQKKERKQNEGEKDVFTFSSHVTLGWHGSWVTLVVVFQFVKTSQLLAQFIFLIHIFTKTRESSQNNCGCAKSSSSALGYASSAQKKQNRNSCLRKWLLWLGNAKHLMLFTYRRTGAELQEEAACESCSFISHTTSGLSIALITQVKDSAGDLRLKI